MSNRVEIRDRWKIRSYLLVFLFLGKDLSSSACRMLLVQTNAMLLLEHKYVPGSIIYRVHISAVPIYTRHSRLFRT